MIYQGVLMNQLKKIEQIAEKALCCEKEIPYKVQKALSEILVIARSHAKSTEDNNSGERKT